MNPTEPYSSRYERGKPAEKSIADEIESRDWHVRPGLRDSLGDDWNKFLSKWHDKNNSPSFLRWFGGDLWVRRDEPLKPSTLLGGDPEVFRSALLAYEEFHSLPSNFWAVDVKTGGCHIERSALETAKIMFEQLNIPTLYIFADIDPSQSRVITAGKAMVNAIPDWGLHVRIGQDADSFTPVPDDADVVAERDQHRTPLYHIDYFKTSGMERFFGEKRSTK